MLDILGLSLEETSDLRRCTGFDDLLLLLSVVSRSVLQTNKHGGVVKTKHFFANGRGLQFVTWKTPD